MEIMETKNKNLLARLTDKLKNTFHFDEHHNKLKKRIATLALTTVLGASMLLTGCIGNGNTPHETDPYGNPITTTAKAGDTTAPTQDPIETGLISFMINNDEYNDAISRTLAAKDSSILRPYSHPLSFLQERGFDIEAIKTGEIICDTVTYIRDAEPDHLYVKTSVLVDDIYSQYLLKYKLDKEEMNDYKYVHDKNYMQKSVALSLISEIKEEIVLKDVKVTKTAYEGIMKGISSNLIYPSSILIYNYSVENQTFDIMIFSKYGPKTNSIGICSLTPNHQIVKLSGDIIVSPTQYLGFIILDSAKEDYTINKEEVKFYYINTLSDITLSVAK